EYFPLQVVFVRPGTPTPVVLAVGTPEELATIQFLIVEPPKYAVILGIPPELFYVPQSGFLGTDWIKFLILKEGRLIDLGAVELRVIGPKVTFSPEFRFEGNLSFSGPAFAWDAYSFTFGLYSRFQYLETEFLATWSESSFTSFQALARIEVESTWPTSWRLPITSTLSFDPTTLSLASWTVDARTTLLGWNLAYYSYYSGANPQTDSYVTFSATGSLNGISVESRMKYATSAPTFAEGLLRLRGPWICGNCPIKWELEFLQKKLGFDHLSFTMREIPIPCPVCEALQTFLDVKITFATDAKTLEPTLRLVSGFAACVRPLVSLISLSPGLRIAGVEVYGVEIRCDLPEGYRARLATSFNPQKDSAVTGYPQFFELIQLEGPVVPCCGSPGWWQVLLYFSRDSGRVFGLAMGDVNVYFPISREVLINLRLQVGLVDPNAPGKTWRISLGWRSLF
ncbi:MAG: hypothetical protein ACUVQS_07240, partial [Candidatus Bipolaricaulaceae bacterium]